MDETTGVLRDLWTAVKNDGQNLIEQIGMDPAVFGPIIGAILVGVAIWFIINNVLG